MGFVSGRPGPRGRHLFGTVCGLPRSNSVGIVRNRDKFFELHINSCEIVCAIGSGVLAVQVMTIKGHNSVCG